MPRWTLHSNVADVLSLGPRTAGRLMQVGVRTVGELLAAAPQAVARRMENEGITAESIGDWQREAQLTIAAPQLSPRAVRTLAALGHRSLERIARSTPTELLAAIEASTREKKFANGCSENSRPSISELTDWIRCARQSFADRVG